MLNFCLKIISELTQHRSQISLTDIQALQEIAAHHVLILEFSPEIQEEKMKVAYELTDAILGEMGVNLPDLLIEKALEAANFSLQRQRREAA